MIQKIILKLFHKMKKELNNNHKLMINNNKMLNKMKTPKTTLLIKIKHFLQL